jgi:hypothetical protein
LEKLNMQFDFIVVGGTVLLHWLPPQKLTVQGGVQAISSRTASPRILTPMCWCWTPAGHASLAAWDNGENSPRHRDEDIFFPFYCTVVISNTPQDWNYTTTLQAGLNGRTVVFPCGFVLGKILRRRVPYLLSHSYFRSGFNPFELRDIKITWYVRADRDMILTGFCELRATSVGRGTALCCIILKKGVRYPKYFFSMV